MTLRILTLNTWKCDGAYRQRLNVMAQGLSELKPDVVLLQEVFATGNGQADTAAHLAQTLSMVATCAPARHKYRWFEGSRCSSRSGLAVLTREPVAEHHVVPLPSDGADGERIAQLVRVVHQGDSFWVANLHLTHLPTASDWRTRQLHTCMTALKRHAGMGRAVIGGDFNAGPGSPEFDRLRVPPWHLDNPFESLHKTTHRTEDGRDLDLDHLLLSGWPVNAVLRAEVTLDPRLIAPPCSVASDHAVVMIDLEPNTSLYSR